MTTDNNIETRPGKGLHDDVAAAVSGMMYISESEAPLELMPWPEVTGLQSVQHKIEEQIKLPAADQTIISAEDFLAGIHQMADPADPVMVEYAKQYDALFDMINRQSKEVVIIRACSAEVHLFIAAFGEEAPVIIHTTTVET